MSTTVQTVSVKVELRRRAGDPVFHRFSGSYTFSDLSTVISHLWGESPKHLVLQYTDDEGDQVHLSSDGEWEECLRVFHRKSLGETPSSSLLRLTAFNVAKEEDAIRRKDATGSTCTGVRSVASCPKGNMESDFWKDICQKVKQVGERWLEIRHENCGVPKEADSVVECSAKWPSVFNCSDKRSLKKCHTSPQRSQRKLDFFARMLLALVVLVSVTRVNQPLQCRIWCSVFMCLLFGKLISKAIGHLFSLFSWSSHLWDGTSCSSSSNTINRTVPAAASAAGIPEVNVLLEVFPEARPEDAVRALHSTSGNVAMAVNNRLTGKW